MKRVDLLSTSVEEGLFYSNRTLNKCQCETSYSNNSFHERINRNSKSLSNEMYKEKLHNPNYYSPFSKFTMKLIWIQEIFPLKEQQESCKFHLPWEVQRKQVKIVRRGMQVENNFTFHFYHYDLFMYLILKGYFRTFRSRVTTAL